MKIFCFFLLIILLLGEVFSYELSISPPKIEFSGKTGETLCREVILSSSDYFGKIYSYDKWIQQGFKEKYLKNYVLDSLIYDIHLDYEKTFYLSSQSSKFVCFNSENQGVYDGILFFITEDKSVEVGLLIHSNISEEGISKITGFSIFERDKSNNEGILIGISFVLIAFLLFLFYKLKSKNEVSKSDKVKRKGRK